MNNSRTIAFTTVSMRKPMDFTVQGNFFTRGENLHHAVRQVLHEAGEDELAYGLWDVYCLVGLRNAPGKELKEKAQKLIEAYENGGDVLVTVLNPKNYFTVSVKKTWPLEENEATEIVLQVMVRGLADEIKSL